jgi:hypothetical protein
MKWSIARNLHMIWHQSSHGDQALIVHSTISNQQWYSQHVRQFISSWKDHIRLQFKHIQMNSFLRKTVIEILSSVIEKNWNVNGNLQNSIFGFIRQFWKIVVNKEIGVQSLGIFINSSILLDRPSDPSTTPPYPETPPPISKQLRHLGITPPYINNSPFPKLPYVPETRYLSINPEEFMKTLEFREQGTHP